MITEESEIPFGTKCRGLKIKACPLDYLEWMVKEFGENSDFYPYAQVAKRIIAADQATLDIERQTQQFLLRHGVDPKQYEV